MQCSTREYNIFHNSWQGNKITVALIEYGRLVNQLEKLLQFKFTAAIGRLKIEYQS